MDYVRLGSAFRAIRLVKRLRQADVAVAAGVCQSAISQIENGDIGRLKIAQLLAVANAMGASLAIDLRWRGGELNKLLDERHAALVDATVALLGRLGWDARPEHTFAIYRENGSIDVLAWFPERRALLVVEVKSAIVDLQDTVSTHDRKRRLAPRMARELGWQPLVVGTLLILPEESQARATVARYRAVVDAAYPSRNREVVRWLHHPERDMRGILFLRPIAGSNTNRELRPRMRVRRPKSTAPAGISRSDRTSKGNIPLPEPPRQPSDSV